MALSLWRPLSCLAPSSLACSSSVDLQYPKASSVAEVLNTPLYYDATDTRNDGEVVEIDDPLPQCAHSPHTGSSKPEAMTRSRSMS